MTKIHPNLGPKFIPSGSEPPRPERGTAGADPKILVLTEPRNSCEISEIFVEISSEISSTSTEFISSGSEPLPWPSYTPSTGVFIPRIWSTSKDDRERSERGPSEGENLLGLR